MKKSKISTEADLTLFYLQNEGAASIIFPSGMICTSCVRFVESTSEAACAASSEVFTK